MMTMGQKVVAVAMWGFLSLIALWFMPIWLAPIYFIPAVGALLLIWRQ